MPDERALRTGSWTDFHPLTLLLQSLRLAVNFRALLLAALAIAATSAGWRLITAMYDRENDAVGRYYYTWPWEPAKSLLPRDDALTGAKLPTSDLPDRPPVVTPTHLPADLQLSDWTLSSPLLHAWKYITDPFSRIFDSRNSLADLGYYLLCALWALVVWAFFGGAISRLAALALARDEQLPLGGSITYARRKWLSYFAAPLFPLLGLLLLALPLALFGLLLRADVGVLIAGLLWFLVVIAGFVMAILALGLFFGWPLMWATISAEGTDSFDALSRTYSYVFQKPIVYLFYVVIAAFLGTVGWLLVYLFATTLLALSHWAVSWGAGPDNLRAVLANSRPGGVGEAGSMLVRFWVSCVMMLALAYWCSYFWTASQAIYFLLRRHVDATELDEVYVPEEEEPYGLPPLRHDEAGVTTVADVPGTPGVEPGSRDVTGL